MITKIQAILSLVPKAEVNIREDVVEWLNPSVAPVTESQIEAEMTRLESEQVTQQQAQATAKQSAIAKLTALGLTADEIAALGVQ